jgi:hypothetical protein
VAILVGCSVKFTIEEEKQNKLNFLDITISKYGNNVSFDIYRKHTTTDTIVPNDSCHPQEHKLAAIKYLANRMEIYNLSATDEKENNTINQILYNNKYDTSYLNKFTTTENKAKLNTPNTKWVKFTYVGKETKFITQLFRNTTLKIAFTTQNTCNRLSLNLPGLVTVFTHSSVSTSSSQGICGGRNF